MLVGLESSDDAGVIKLDDERALVQTVDFITPIVDDPYYFGRIAAANSLSDVYAMGGTPLTALNICLFPVTKLESENLKRILAGALSAVVEAGAFLVGGHSIEDKELKFGLSVTGIVHPKGIWRNNTPQNGNGLVLTKPLGTGIISTAIKAGMADEKDEAEIIVSMSSLNKTASEVAKKYSPSACTDVTGFGLIGHLSEMISGSGKGALLKSSEIPLFSSVLEHASSGMIPGGAGANKKTFECRVDCSTKIDDLVYDILFDPQTSGGLLLSVADPNGFIEELASKGIKAWSIGEINDNSERIEIR